MIDDQAPPAVHEVARSYLRLADEHAPGLIEGLYLVGSAALGEYRPGASDVDFVAVTTEPLDDSSLAALDLIHARLRRRHRRPFFDGCYVTFAELRHDPAAARPGPGSHEGRFRRTPGPRDPVAWHTLAQCGIRSRGPEVADLHVWTDPEALRRWALRNLDDYWGRLRRAGERPASLHRLAALTPNAVVWCVTGLTRVHYTLATGRITTKEGGTRHALTAFEPRWRPLLRETLRLRRRAGGPSFYRTPFARRRDLLTFWDVVYADCQRLGARPAP